MKFLELALRRLAGFQKRHTSIIFLIILAITIFMILGIPKVKLQSDFSKSYPQDMEAFKLQNDVKDTFGGQDVILVLITLDDKYDFKDNPKDITDSKIVSYITELHESLSDEPSINAVTSIGSISSGKGLTPEQMTEIINSREDLSGFFSEDKTKTFIIIRTDVGSSEEKVQEIDELIRNKLDSFSQPAGTKISITGSPAIRVTVLDILMKDAIFTMFLAIALIFILLIILEKSLIRSILIFIPLILGLIWTIGSMGWLNIEISMATAGLGAMILGLGVEYGVFMLKRYEEERAKGKDQLESLQVSVPGVGLAILGSGLTTIAGFLALTLSSFPLLQKLGMGLALGIFFCLFGALFIAPVIFIVSEKLEDKIDNKLIQLIHRRLEKKPHLKNSDYDKKFKDKKTAKQTK